MTWQRRLTDTDLAVIFERAIVPEYMDAANSVAFPRLVVVGGPPGSGKSHAMHRLQRQMPGAVAVLGDDLRAFHPQYRDLLADAPLLMPDVTAQASGRWVELSLEYLREQRVSTLLETTLRQPEVVASTLSAFQRAGFVNELHVVVVPRDVAWLGTVTRYVRQLQRSGEARWTPPGMALAAMRNLPVTLERVVRGGLADRVDFTTRRGELVARLELSGVSDVQWAVDELHLALAATTSEMSAETAMAWLAELRSDVEALAELGERNPQVNAAVAVLIRDRAPRAARAAYLDDLRAEQAVLREILNSASPELRNAVRTPDVFAASGGYQPSGAEERPERPGGPSAR